jgi:hypothetical protein
MKERISAADLSQHGAVFDTLPDGPISVTWCGVCNTGVVFRAAVKGRTLHFQYDRMVGANEVQKDLEVDALSCGSHHVGRVAQAVPAHDGAQALAGIRGAHAQSKHAHQGLTRLGPEGAPNGAFALDKRLPARETVAGLEVDGETVAYPFSELRIARVVNDHAGGLPIVIVHQPSSDTTTAFDARSKGKVLTFRAANDDASSVTDLETRSTWNAYGLCLEGPLKGTQLKQLILVPQFWFAWSQFHQGTRVFTAR